MALVAIVAILIGADRMRQWRDHCLALRSSHEMRERFCLLQAQGHASTAEQDEGEAKRLRDAARDHPDEPFNRIADACESQAAVERAAEQTQRALARYHHALRLKYDRAARYPWRLVSSDPPLPEG
jgi:hypothetical protein